MDSNGPYYESSISLLTSLCQKTNKSTSLNAELLLLVTTVTIYIKVDSSLNPLQWVPDPNQNRAPSGWNGTRCLQRGWKIHRCCLTAASQHGPPSPWSLSNSLLNQCFDEFSCSNGKRESCHVLAKFTRAIENIESIYTRFDCSCI